MKKEFDKKEWERKERERDALKRDVDNYMGTRVLLNYIGIALGIVLALALLFWESCGRDLTTVYPNGKPSTTPSYPTTYTFEIEVGGETVSEFDVTIPQGGN